MSTIKPILSKIMTASCFFFAAFSVIAVEVQGNIEYIKVENNIVTFKTDTSDTIPLASCAVAANIGVWTMPLSTSMGRAMYAGLMMASNGKKPIKINLSGVCDESEGFESVNSITVVELNVNNDSSTSGPPTKSLKLVGKGVRYYFSNKYHCQIFVSAKNAASQPYIYSQNGSCICRDSLSSNQPLGEYGYKRYGAELSCYIEE